MDLNAARAFLLRRQRPDGVWADFRTLAGESTSWTTAYVAGSLGGGEAEDAACHQAALALIREQQLNGGWGYNAAVPSDCDSTAFAILFLSRFRSKDQVANLVDRSLGRAAHWLLASQKSDGGFSTYPSSEAIRAFMTIGADVALDGWCTPQVEVTAACGLALDALSFSAESRRAWESVVGVRRPNGTWPSYWWTNELYTTAHALQLAEKHCLGEPSHALMQGVVDFLRGSQASSGAWRDGHNGHDSVFATALAIRALTSAGVALNSPEMRLTAAWLSSRQRADGSWEGEPVLRIPPPYVLDPQVFQLPWRQDGLGTAVTVRDHHSLFTTATVLRAFASH